MNNSTKIKAGFFFALTALIFNKMMSAPETRENMKKMPKRKGWNFARKQAKKQYRKNGIKHFGTFSPLRRFN